MRVVDRHTENIRISSYLSKLPMIGREQKKDVVRLGPEDVIPILKAQQIDFVLAGAHGIAGWLAEPRATQDVDVILKVRDRKKATEAILKKFPDLVLEKHPVVWRFKNGEQYIIDLMFTNSPLFKRVTAEFVVKKIGRFDTKIPKLEAAIAMKFAAMIGPFRNKRKSKQDVVDVMSIVERNKDIDLAFLSELGELVYEGGGKEIVKIIDDIRAGRDVEI